MRLQFRLLSLRSVTKQTSTNVRNRETIIIIATHDRGKIPKRISNDCSPRRERSGNYSAHTFALLISRELYRKSPPRILRGEGILSYATCVDELLS